MAFGRPKRPAVERFWERVVIIDDEDSCWLREGSNNNGYSTFRNDDGDMVYAHIFSYELHFGPVPDGFQINHTCDTRNCIRPKHVYAGTQSQNIVDSIYRGRWHNLSHETRARLQELRSSDV